MARVGWTTKYSKCTKAELSVVGVVPGIRDWQAVLRIGLTTKLTKGTKVASEGYD